MATRTQNGYYGEHVIAFSLINDSHLSWGARLLSVYLAGHGLRDVASPRDARIMQYLDISQDELSKLKRELDSDSDVWSVDGETRYGSTYRRTSKIKEHLVPPSGWNVDWRYDMHRQTGLRWLGKYSTEHHSDTLILLALALDLTTANRRFVRVSEGSFDLMDTARDLPDALGTLSQRGYIDIDWAADGHLYARWSESFRSMLLNYSKSWFAPSINGESAEIAYGVDRWKRAGRPLPEVGSRDDIWYFYTLRDPRTGLIRYAGMSLDPTYRILNNYGTNREIARRDLNNRDLAAWLRGLRDEGLDPIHDIHHEMSVTGSRGQAETSEGQWIRSLRVAGNPLLNREHLTTSPRS